MKKGRETGIKIYTNKKKRNTIPNVSASVELQPIPREEPNSSYSFAIRKEVYVSAGVAMAGTVATVATYITLS